MKFVFATGNRNKIRQFGEIFAEKGLSAELLSAKDVGFTNFPPEDADTFYGNSLIKAKALFDYILRNNGSCDCYVAADDSGVSVDALGGGPGVRSARFAGDNATVRENNLLLLKKLEGTENRAAHYFCAMTVITPEGRIMCCGGRVDGRIIDEPRGFDGFGYDPYFYVDSFGKTFAELSPETRNSISHRGQALRSVIDLVAGADGSA